MEKPFVIVTELALPDHWHVYYKLGTVGLPWKPPSSLCPASGEGPFWQIRNWGKGL
ncbi:MAG: hypothetical protein ACLSUW_00175 [Akkermansia sp.]